MKRFLAISILAGMSVIGLSLGTFAKVFETNYKVADDSTLGKAKCQICHVKKMGGKELNPYGLDVKAALGGKKVLTSAVLKAVEGKDSNKNGVTNLAEIKADKLPGAK